MNGPGKKPILDKMGMVKGYVEEDANGNKKVTDYTGKVLGTSNSGGTSNFAGKKLSQSDNPEALFDLDEEDED